MPESTHRRAYRSAYKKRLRQEGRVKTACVEFYGEDLALYEHAAAHGPVAAYIKGLIRRDMGVTA